MASYSTWTRAFSASLATMTFVDDLLAGPRGRRLLLEFALASDSRMGEGALHHAVFHAGHHLDPDKERISFFTIGGTGRDSPTRPVVSAEAVAEKIAVVPLAEPTAELLREVLQISVEQAMYWQRPEGTDALAATGPVLAQLRRVAEHLAGTSAVAWWAQDVPLDSQWCVRWREGAIAFPRVSRTLSTWREKIHELETRLMGTGREYNDEWWSTPPFSLCASTRELPNGTPAGLHGVEDTSGPENAWAHRIIPPADARIFTISGAEAWAELCGRFPLEVTAQNQNQWQQTTGYIAKWVIPDYAQVAQHYDAVHLSVRGYLATAGRAVPADDDHAALLAGWNPDETFWLTDKLSTTGTPVTWALDKTGTWQRS